MEEYILGIELGSTRIKAILTDENANVSAQGNFEWENKFYNGYWTYSMEDAIKGLQESYAELKKDFKGKTGKELTQISAIGISGMMHGYLPFNENGEQLAPFRTWRSTVTEEAAEKLSELFKFNIPQRWSVAHFYQAILNKEEHIKDVAHLTTLAGYIHYLLTGKRVMGIGEASGMFPVKNGGYDKDMLCKFNKLLKENGIDKNFENILPTVLTAGENAGTLTQEGAKLLDVSGMLEAGAVFCPPEGDMQTGMIATNSISPCMGNVSAGTSGNMVVILEKSLAKYYKEIDVFATPEGHLAAMAHVNTFTSEINSWVNLFSEVLSLFGKDVSKGEVFEKLFKKSLESDENVGKLFSYNFLDGEPIAGVKNGKPLLARDVDGNLNLANLMKSQIYASLGSLASGVKLLKKEGVKINSVIGHGGFFKTEFVGQSAMSAAVDAPVTVAENSGEGGAFGIALLALYTYKKDKPLQEFLDDIFKNVKKLTVTADEKEKQGFKAFMERYDRNLKIEQNF